MPQPETAIDDDPYANGKALADLYADIEYAAKRANLLRLNRADAQADWRQYADLLGSDFFAEVARCGIAKTLIEEPPGRLMREPLGWQPGNPLKNVRELFERGVCRVRNSFIHGEKFVSGGNIVRDATLVADALAVLRLAISQQNGVTALLPQRQF